jgi:hypothetical protein
MSKPRQNIETAQQEMRALREAIIVYQTHLQKAVARLHTRSAVSADPILQAKIAALKALCKAVFEEEVLDEAEKGKTISIHRARAELESLMQFITQHKDTMQILKQRRGHGEGEAYSKFWRVMDTLLQKLGIYHWSVTGARLLKQTEEVAYRNHTTSSARKAVALEAQERQQTHDASTPIPPAVVAPDPLPDATPPASVTPSASSPTLTDLPSQALARITSFLPNLPDVVSLAKVSRFTHSALAQEGVMKKRAFEPLLLAVMEDDRKKAALILEQYPEYALRVKQKQKLIFESKYTFQKFDLEGCSPLALACQMRELEMVKLLLPAADSYIASLKREEGALKEAALKEKREEKGEEDTQGALKNLEKTIKQAEEERTKALALWKPYATHHNERGEEEITIPPYYQALLQPLIDAFTREAFPNGEEMEALLSDVTEVALASFREQILPPTPIKPDYLDPELLLLAAYMAYDLNFNQFQSWDQREHFCAKVIGFIQSILSPETAKVFCEGLYEVVEENKPISARAASLRLLRYGRRETTAPFYREAASSVVGLGYKDKYTHASRGCSRRGGGWRGGVSPAVAKLWQSKTTSFQRLCKESNRNTNAPAKMKRPG